MSGQKRATISIDQEEYQRLKDAEIQLRALPAPVQEIQQQIHEKTQEGIRSSLDWVAQRQNEFAQTLSGFNANLREVELATSRALVEQQDQLVHRLQSDQEQMCGSLWNNMSHELSRVHDVIVQEHHRSQEELKRYENRTARQINELNQQAYQVGQQTQRIARHIADDAQRKLTYAEDWLLSAESLCDFIKNHYACSFFAPGEAERLEAQLITARENLAAGMPEAVLVSAQGVYTAFSELRLWLERASSEWDVFYFTAWERACQVHAAAVENEVVQAIDLQGNLLEAFLNVDYWSEGQWSMMINDVEALLYMLQDQQAQPDITTLKGIVAETIPDFQARLEDAVLDARVAVLNSQIRVNIADMVVQALKEQGFSLETSSYSAADMRQPYSARLKGYDGAEVLVEVTPTGKEIGENDLQVKSLDANRRTHHELLQRWREINRSLARRGLNLNQSEPAVVNQGRQRSMVPFSKPHTTGRGQTAQQHSGR